MTELPVLLRGLNEIIDIKRLECCLTCTEQWLIVNCYNLHWWMQCQVDYIFKLAWLADLALWASYRGSQIISSCLVIMALEGVSAVCMLYSTQLWAHGASSSAPLASGRRDCPCHVHGCSWLTASSRLWTRVAALRDILHLHGDSMYAQSLTLLLVNFRVQL